MFTPHREWLADLGGVFIWMSMFALLLDQLASYRRGTERLRLLCSAANAPARLVRSILWLRPLLLTTLAVSIILRITAICLRGLPPILHRGLGVVEELFVGSFWAYAMWTQKFHRLVGQPELQAGPASYATSLPKSAKFILLLIPKSQREHLIGDLEEEYNTIVLPEYGVRKARGWYWWQVAISVGPLLWAQIRRGAFLAWLWKQVR